MKYANRKKLESLILLIDFRKAFDSLSNKYINECLKMFNFGPSIRKWVSLFFSNREAYIVLGGELSKRILLEHGVSQGDVVWPYIFILAVELLLIKINNTKLILTMPRKNPGAKHLQKTHQSSSGETQLT